MPSVKAEPWRFLPRVGCCSECVSPNLFWLSSSLSLRCVTVFMDRLIVSGIGLPSFARWRRTHAAA